MQMPSIIFVDSADIYPSHDEPFRFCHTRSEQTYMSRETKKELNIYENSEYALSPEPSLFVRAVCRPNTAFEILVPWVAENASLTGQN